MIGQRALLVLALVAGAIAGVLYYVGLQRLPVVVATRDLDPLRPIELDDVTVIGLPADAVPVGAAIAPDEVVGRFVRAPLWSGQILLHDGLAESAAAFRSGLLLPADTRAIALPVGPSQAVGGAVAPGSRVDVIAVPVFGRAPAGRSTEVVAVAVLVIDVRGEHGGAYHVPVAARSSTAMAERLGSVVVAISPAEELLVADRVATSTFVLVLVTNGT